MAFSAYALYQYLGSAPAAYATQNTSAPSKQVVNNGNLAQSAPPPNPILAQTGSSATPPVTTPTPTPAPAPKGQYVDGTYTGNTVNAYYGNVQVQVTVSGGKITNVQFLQYPSDRNTSRYINSYAMPILISEAIQTQSAQVNGVSGASETSPAFVQSLASALVEAKS